MAPDRAVNWLYYRRVSGLKEDDRAEVDAWLAAPPPWESIAAATVAADGAPTWWTADDEEGVHLATLRR